MSIPEIKRPSPAMVIAIIALIVAGGGTAEAVSTHALVRKGEIAKEAVTSKALAKGAVHPKAISKGAVHAVAIGQGAVGPGALAGGAVTGPAIAPDAITSGSIAPGSVYGGALGATTIHSASITDLDVVPENPVWTASSTVTAPCTAGEHVITGGIVFTNAGDREVSILQSTPFVNGPNQGWIGQISSNSGGTATAEVQALCLK